MPMKGSRVIDHPVILIVIVAGFAWQTIGLVIMTVMLRECQRLTRGVAGLVYQEGERTRNALGRG